MDFVTLLLFLGFAFLLWKFLYLRPHNFPPGPRGFPIMGYMYSLIKLNKGIHKGIDIVSKQYGPVVGLYAGFKPFIIFTGFDAVNEALRREEFDGRTQDLPTVFPKWIAGRGIANAQGEVFKIQRRFTLHHLRNFGFGKNSLEGTMLEEITDLNDLIQQKSKNSADKSVPIERLFHLSIANVLWSVVAGERYKHDDPKLKTLLERIDDVVALVKFGDISDIFPFLRKLFPKYTGFERKQNMYKDIVKFLEDSIEEHKKTHDPSHPRDFMDSYITQMKENGKDFTMDDLLAICMAFFTAGTETTSTFLSLMILFMIKYPDVQKKVQKELDEIVGRNRLPSLEDKDNLVYTNAMITEVLRINSIAVITAPHAAMKTTEFKGYTIPKDSILVLSIFSVHMDKSYWGDPETFRPERFIDENGKLRKDDHFIPFGIGKRTCTGKSLARRNGFLFTAALLHTFTFRSVPGQTLPDPTDVSSTITMISPDFNFIPEIRE